MKYRRFKIRATQNDITIWYWVKIFESKLEMQKYCMAKDERYGNAEPWERYTRAAGFCKKWNRVLDPGEEPPPEGNPGNLHPEIGEILLHTGAMGGATLAHEVSHAAWWAYDTIFQKQSVDDIEDEENLCYLMSDLYHMAINKMFKLKLWD